MKEQIKKRLNSLEQEYQKGQEELQRLEKEVTTIQATMLRISGAIQVLKEELEIEDKESNQVVEFSGNNHVKEEVD